MCAILRISISSPRAEFPHFTAEAGRVSYFRSQPITSRSVEMLELEKLDSDEGQYLIAMYPLSISQPKK